MSCCGGQCGCSHDGDNGKKDCACSTTEEKTHDQGGCCGGHNHEIELSAEQISLLNRLIEDNADEDLTPEEVEQIRQILFTQG